MALTVNSKTFSVVGDKALVIADIALDSSYPFGGESVNTDQLFGIHAVEAVILEAAKGYSLQYDYTNNKIRVFAPAPPIVKEEKLTPSSDVVALRYPAAFIMNIARSENNKKFRSTGIAIASLSDDECCLVSQMEEGSRTQIRVKDYDRLAGDGAFTGGTTNWTFNATPWTYGTNNLEKDAGGVNALTHDNFAAVIGRTYRLSLSLAKQGAEAEVIGTITPTLGGTAGAATTADTTGTYTWEITATTTDGLSLAPSDTGRFVLDDIKIYDITEPVYVTYVTQAWKEVWENLVQDESVTLASGATSSLANAAVAVMYADRTSATAKALVIIDEDDTAASGEVAIYMNQTLTNIKATHADENAKVAKFTYIKKPASGFLADRVFDNEAATKAGGDPYTNTFDYPILIWGYTGQLPVNGGTTQVLINYAGTPAAGEAVIDWYNPGTRGAGAPAAGTVIGLKSDLTGTGAGIWGVVSDIQNLQPLEVADGIDLSGLSSVRMILIGT
jgi:hypothetical protein